MKRTILYFPNIEIPDGQWIRNSLLYWDEISSIVPETPEYDNNNISPELDYLYNAGQYRPINPQSLLKSELYQEFESELTSKIRGFRSRGTGRNRNSLGSSPGQYRIYNDKLNYRMIELLKEEGVLSRVESEEWVNMDGKAGYLYMSLLAKYLAIADENHTVIGTDQTQYCNYTYPIATESLAGAGNDGREPFISNHLKNILPTPVPDVPFEEIIDFKHRYRDELLQFRAVINDFENQLGQSESIHEVKDHIVSFKEQIELGTNEVGKALHGARIKFIFSSLRSLVNPKAPELLTNLPTSISSILPPIEVPTVGTLASGAIEIGASYFEMKDTLREKLANNSFVYLYQANRQGIISNIPAKSNTLHRN